MGWVEHYEEGGEIMPKCEVIAIANQKGGVGKTTTTFSLGVALAKAGKRVLLVDADPQGDLTTYMGWHNIDEIPVTLATLMERTLAGKTKTEKLNLIKKYQNQGYYLAMEVLGDTGQHWVAIVNVLGDEIKMVDPSSDNIDVWSTYNWKNSSQFVYFQANLAS